MNPNIKQATRLKENLKGKLLTRLQFSQILKLSEKEFAALISNIENQPIFQKLVHPSDQGPRAIFRRRYPHTRLSSGFYEIKEEDQPGTGTVDVESLLLKHQNLTQLIQRIGQKNFEDHFLYNEDDASPDSIAKICHVQVEEVQRVQQFLDEISIHSEFIHPSHIPTSGFHYTTIAKIEIGPENEISIAYLSPHLARGRYIVNHERVDSLKKSLDREEKKLVSEFLKKIEWINLRQDTLQRILTEWIQKEEIFLQDRKWSSYSPWSQRRLAQIIGVAPSTICRAISFKSVLLPWGEEKALKDLFVHRKQMAQLFLKDILEEIPVDGRDKISDNSLRELLLDKYRIQVSRRSINLYRNAIFGLNQNEK